ncbi:MAG: hypothetical protein JW759_04035 [Candidatus Coatesbacteria bacterium]|nr:hypothetical protein [Candidatus Coatesbacteria bacterium]
MRTWKPRELEKSLTAKGFKKHSSHHDMYRLYVDGQKTCVKTFVSHSLTEYGADLLGKMRRQMQLQTNKPLFDRLLECPASHEDYVRELKRANILAN